MFNENSEGFVTLENAKKMNEKIDFIPDIEIDINNSFISLELEIEYDDTPITL